MVVLLTIVAGVVRIYRVSEVPGGLHGDEALTGLDALRIVQEGWIGPYVGSALGQPSGALYFTALLFKLSEPSIFILHLSMALLGVAGVPAAYLLFRIGFGRWIALFGTVALTFSYWHLFYSRSAYIVISMPLMTTLAAVAVLIALRSSTRWAWLAAGILLGLGVYSYAGYIMFLTVVVVFLTFVLVLGRDDLKSYVARLAILAVGFVVAVLPMVHMAYSEPDFYFQRHRLFLREPRFEGAETLVDKVSYLGGRAWDAAILPLRYSRVDGVDGMGGKGVLDPIFGLLAYTGLAIAVARWRSPPHLLMAISFAVGLSPNPPKEGVGLAS